MNEKSDQFRILNEILDHPKNRDLDAHERHALYVRLHQKDFIVLQTERAKIATRFYE